MLKLALPIFVFAPFIVTFELITVFVPAIVELDTTFKTAESISTFAVAVSVIRSSEEISISPSFGEFIANENRNGIPFYRERTVPDPVAINVTCFFIPAEFPNPSRLSVC